MSGERGEKGKGFPFDVGSGKGARVGWGWKDGPCIDELDEETGFRKKCDEGIFWGVRNSDINGNFSGRYLGYLFFDEKDLDEKSFDSFGEDYGHTWQWFDGKKEWEKVREFDNQKNVFGIYENKNEKEENKKKYKFVVGESPHGLSMNQRVILTETKWAEVVVEKSKVGNGIGGWPVIEKALEELGSGWVKSEKIGEACREKKSGNKWVLRRKKSTNQNEEVCLAPIKVSNNSNQNLITSDDWKLKRKKRNWPEGKMSWLEQPLIKMPRQGKTNERGACLIRWGNGDKSILRKLWFDTEKGWICGDWMKNKGVPLDSIYKMSQGGNNRDKKKLCDFIFKVDQGAGSTGFFGEEANYVGQDIGDEYENKVMCVTSWNKWSWVGNIRK